MIVQQKYRNIDLYTFLEKPDWHEALKSQQKKQLKQQIWFIISIFLFIYDLKWYWSVSEECLRQFF